jgi:hypothetical protein
MLEAEWNTKLREQEEARAIEKQYNQSDQHQVSLEERTEISGVASTLPPILEEPQDHRAPTQACGAPGD